jgi:hypothetical protein
MDGRSSATTVAKRKNTITRKKYPLFAAHLAELDGFYICSADVEKKRVRAKREAEDRAQEREVQRKENQKQADYLFDVIRGLAGDEMVEQIKERANRIYRAAWGCPGYQCDVLIRIIRGLDQPSAYENCPHWRYSWGLHNVGSYSLEVCPVCGGPVPQLCKPEEKPVEEQLNLF